MKPGDAVFAVTKTIMATVGKFFSIAFHKIKMRQVYKESRKSD
jgi:hypothetical protein